MITLRTTKRTAGLLLLSAAAISMAQGCTRRPPRRDELVARPLNLDDPQLAAGRRVFIARCTICHPGGAAGAGPALNNKRVLTERLIKYQVRHGVGAMPRFSERRIPDGQLDDLVAYVRALRESPVDRG